MGVSEISTGSSAAKSMAAPDNIPPKSEKSSAISKTVTKTPPTAITSKATSLCDAIINFFFKAKVVYSNITTLKPSVDSQNKISVKTDDGYTLQFIGQREEWTITKPSGKTTTIWGDPHVVESDGDKWDFKEKSSFIFGNNKITVQTVPAYNGNTFTQTVSIYNDKDCLIISDIDKNLPKIEKWKFSAKAEDKKLTDGITYKLANSSDDREVWVNSARHGSREY